MSEVHSTSRPYSFHYDPTTDVCYRLLDFMEFPGYRVGDDGSLWTRWKRTSILGSWGGSRVFLGDEWKRLSPHKQPSGHNRTFLYPGKIRFMVYHLTLTAFVGPCPPGMECCHKDDNPQNNYLHNLRWDTHKGNTGDRDRNGRTARGSKHGLAKLKEETVKAIRVDLALDTKRGRYNRMAKKYHVHRSIVSRIDKGILWKHA